MGKIDSLRLEVRARWSVACEHGATEAELRALERLRAELRGLKLARAQDAARTA